MVWFTVLLVLTGLERIGELVVSRRNLRWSLARGGVESGQRQVPAFVALHVGLLVGAFVEVLVADRPFIPALGWSMLVLVLLSQGLRYWCVTTLGPRWNTRIVIVPGLPPVRRGPYRWLRHPNYVAVVVEGVALPLVHTAWVTAIVFTALEAVLLRARITAENAALAQLPAAA